MPSGMIGIPKLDSLRLSQNSRAVRSHNGNIASICTTGARQYLCAQHLSADRGCPSGLRTDIDSKARGKFPADLTRQQMRRFAQHGLHWASCWDDGG